MGGKIRSSQLFFLRLRKLLTVDTGFYMMRRPLNSWFYILFFTSIILDSSILLSQTEEWKFYFAQYKNLPDMHVNTIAVDSNKITWFGTDNGFASFDGVTWKQYKKVEYNLPDSIILKIIVDKDNCKWIATRNGLIKFNDTTFTIFDTTNSSLSETWIHTLALDNMNNVWAATRTSIVKFSGNHSEEINIGIELPGNLEFDKSGTLWTTDRQGSLIKYDGDTTRSFLYKRFISIDDIDSDTSGNIWFSTSDGIVKFNGNTFTLFSEVSAGGNMISTVNWDAVACDDKGNIWFNSDSGIVKFSGTDAALYLPPESKSPVYFINDFCFDENKIWVGFSQGNVRGAIEINGDVWTNYDASYGLPSNVIRSIAVDKNNVKWLGTSSGLAKLQGGKWTVYNIFNSPLPSNLTTEIEIDDSGSVWIGTVKGLAKFNGTEWWTYTKENSGLAGNVINGLTLHGDTIWIGTSGGLSRFDGRTWISYTEENSGWPDNRCRDISIDKAGNKWILVGTVPLIKFRGSNWTTVPVPDKMIYNVFIDSLDRKWIAAQSGLYMFNDTTWTLYNEENTGIALNDAWRIKQDRSGNLVVGLYWGRGIVIFDGKNWKHYNTLNPFLNEGVNCYDLNVDTNNNILIADFGLVLFNETGIILRYEDPYETKPKQFILHQNYPNPFNPSTVIRISIPVQSQVKLAVYNMLGEQVASVVNEELPAGYHEYTYDASSLSSGIYLYRVEAADFVSAKKMILIK